VVVWCCATWLDKGMVDWWQEVAQKNKVAAYG